jgi:hypothetical protein
VASDHPEPTWTVLPAGWSPSDSQLEVLADLLIRLARQKRHGQDHPDRVPTRERRQPTPGGHEEELGPDGPGS